MKKLVTFILSVLLLLSLSPTAFASYTPIKIKSLHPQLAGELAYSELDGQAVPMTGLTGLSVATGSELRVYLFGTGGDSLFYDQDGLPVTTADVTLSRLRAAQVDLSVTQLQSGTGWIEVDLGYSHKTDRIPTAAPYISVVFEQASCSVEASPFSVTIQLSLAGSTQPGASLHITGSIDPVIRELSAETVSVDISDGSVAVPKAGLKSVSASVGDGVILSTGMTQDTRYAAAVQMDSLDQGSGEDPLLRYRLQYVGFSHYTCTVRFDRPELQYVYDGQGNYLGTTRETHPLLEEYYIAGKKLQQLQL